MYFPRLDQLDLVFEDLIREEAFRSVTIVEYEF